MQIAITVPPHDPKYVEQRGGVELLSHLRAAPSRVEYRRLAIQRAYDRFAAAEDNGLDDSRLGGLGLIVLQRALLAVEDLGGMLHAFAGPDPWIRLRSAKITDITTAFDRALATGSDASPEAFRLATEKQIADEGLTADEVRLLHNARASISRRWAVMLRRAADLWSGSPVAKATMHGFPIVSGEQLLGPPAAA
jgi:hypothetical protein